MTNPQPEGEPQSSIDRWLTEPATDQEDGLTLDATASVSDAGIDLVRLQELKEHPKLDELEYLRRTDPQHYLEVLEARSAEFVAPEERKAAREFVANVLLIKDPDEQTQHLYKYRLKDFNPNADGTLKKWSSFNEKATEDSLALKAKEEAPYQLRIQVIEKVRNLDAPRAEKLLEARDKRVLREREFIDGRHQQEAESLTVVSRALWLPPEDRELLLHIHYDESRSPTGRFEPTAWEYFNRACDHVDMIADSGEPISANHLLEINALLQRGEIPADPTEVMRTRYDVSGVFRSTDDLVRTFDQAGRYKSAFFLRDEARPKMFGFATQRQFFRDAAPILREIHYDRPEIERYRELEEQVRAVTERAPHDLAVRQQQRLVQILRERHSGDKEAMVADFKNPYNDPQLKRQRVMLCVDRAELKEHINHALLGYRKAVVLINDRFGTPEKLARNEAAFKKAVVSLGVELGSVIDMGHFALDGMGRTNLQTERLVMRQMGLQRGAPINVVHKGVTYENGTYVPKNVRISAILATLSPMDSGQIATAVGKLNELSGRVTRNEPQGLEVLPEDHN